MKWEVPYMWENADVWIIGGGPSVPYQFGVPEDIIKQVLKGEKPMSAFSPYMSDIHKEHVIGINVAFMLGNWVDMMFFGDLQFYKRYKNEIASFPGLKVTCVGKFKDNNIRWLKVLEDEKKNRTGISNYPQYVCWNSNSGAAAISIAANAGAGRIILVGFDMKHTDKKQQWFHNVYNKQGKAVSNNPPFERHLRGFIKIAKDAERRGIEIINTSPDSAITQFRKCTVKEILDEKKMGMVNKNN